MSSETDTERVNQVLWAIKEAMDPEISPEQLAILIELGLVYYHGVERTPTLTAAGESHLTILD